MTVIPLRPHRQRGACESNSPPAPSLVEQWASLLEVLSGGCASVSTSAEQMAEELPAELVDPVNAELRQLGCSFQVSRPKPPVHRLRRRVERGKARPGAASNG
ncbi:hypothetical protein [Vulcanococcus sp.]|jgi:hypothetical protein|uniref:hypothetical protein n=1 Tax=Vulcanococcus sp. TaxID=2856995 RepID=UPI003227D4E2